MNNYGVRHRIFLRSPVIGDFLDDENNNHNFVINSDIILMDDACDRIPLMESEDAEPLRLHLGM